MPRLRACAGLLASAGLVSLWPAGPAPAEDAVPAGAPAVAPPPSPFLDLVERIHVGQPTTVGSLAVLALWSLPEASRPSQGPGAWVGLVGTDAALLDLPAPVGLGVVRVTNALGSPLLIPRGEALIPQAGESRVVDRPVWIAAGASAFVPVAQSTDQPAPGPYQPLADRASPALLRALRLGHWPQVVHEWNASLAITGDRVFDPLAGFSAPVFVARADLYLAELAKIRATVAAPLVGLAVVDEGGLSTIFLDGDAARFRALWPGLARGVALDAVVRATRGWGLLPHEISAKAVEETLEALKDLRTPPAVRPAFGEGEQLRWPATLDVARWYGLEVAGAPIEATYHRPGGGPPAAAPPAPPGGPPSEPPPPPHVPGGPELDRKQHPTPFDERLKDRRDAAMGGGG